MRINAKEALESGMKLDRVEKSKEESKSSKGNSLNFGANIDARLSKNIDVTFSGSYYDSKNQFTPSGAWSLYNWRNNPFAYNSGYRGSVRIRHKLGNQSIDLDDEEIITLVGAGDEDYENGKYLITSPLGQGLLGKKVNDEVEIPVPKGTISFKVLEISFPDE